MRKISKTKIPDKASGIFLIGGTDGTRTRDLLRDRQLNVPNFEFSQTILNLLKCLQS